MEKINNKLAPLPDGAALLPSLFFLNRAVLSWFFSLEATLPPKPCSSLGHPPPHSCSSGASPPLPPLFSSSLASTRLSWGIFSSPAPKPALGMRSMSSLLLPNTGTQTLSLLRAHLPVTLREKGETKLTDMGKLPSSDSHRNWSTARPLF